MSVTSNDIGPELFALFRDDMLIKRSLQLESPRSSGEVSRHNLEIAEFRAPGKHISARLDLMGIDERFVAKKLDQQFAEKKSGMRARKRGCGDGIPIREQCSSLKKKHCRLSMQPFL